jgi:hypothetical protein
MVQGIELNTELIDEVCLENEKSYQRIQAIRQKKNIADLLGDWTTDGNYVFRFELRDSALVGTVRQPSTGRVFALEDIVVDGSNVRFFVVHEADWDEEVKQNGGKRFRNTAEGTFSDKELKIRGSREGSNERAYEAVMKRVAPAAGGALPR